MSDEEALIRAILADPEDRTARLVYADWLDERGDRRGAHLRALCDGVAWGGDPADRLRGLQVGINPDWSSGCTPGSPGAGWVSTVRSAFTATSGWPVAGRPAPSTEPVAHLRRAAGGHPDRGFNDDRIERAMAEARGRAAGRRARLIDPSRRGYLRAPGDMAGIARSSHLPEWLPAVTCVGWFGDVYSELAVV